MNYIRGIRISEQADVSSYPFRIPAIVHLKGMDSLAFEKPVTFFVGENGTGKSTLLEPIAYRDTEHYRLTKQLLDNPERMLRYLLGK